MEDEHDGDIDRQPRGIEESEQALAGQKLPKRGQVVQRLGDSALPAAVQGLFKRHLEQAVVQQGFQAGTDPDQYLRAHPFQ